MFTSSGYERDSAAGGGLGGVGDGMSRTAGGDASGGGRRMDSFVFCVPGGKPKLFYRAAARSAKSSHWVQASNRHIDTPIVAVPAGADANGRKPDLGPLRG